MMNNWQQEAKSMSSDLHKTKNELESSKRQCEEVLPESICLSFDLVLNDNDF